MPIATEAVWTHQAVHRKQPRLEAEPLNTDVCTQDSSISMGIGKHAEPHERQKVGRNAGQMKKDEKRERMMNRVATQPHSEVQETSTHESGTGKQ